MFDKYDAEILQKNQFFLFYEMMVKTLETDNVIEGMNESLFLLKLATNSDCVILYKQDDNGDYRYYDCNTGMNNNNNNNVAPISYIVNKTGKLIELKKELDLELDLDEDFKRVKLLHLKTKDHQYILALKNRDLSIGFSPEFYKKLEDTMQIILKRAESYERNTRAINIDLLTGLDNRNSYEKRIEEELDSKEDSTYCLFDLFRLKYVNDTFSHALGDAYIKGAADVLKRYWPKTTQDIINGEEVEVPTGHCVYRIGGDEFALLTTGENIEMTRIKAQLAAEELKLLDLGLADDIPLGLNYGLTTHRAGDSMKKTYVVADQIMQDHKRSMYEATGLDRRR